MAGLTYISISFSLGGILPLKHRCGSSQGESVQVSCVRTALVDCADFSAREAAQEYTEATQKCFLCALLSYTGNISLVLVWQAPLSTLTTNARSTRHIVPADHVSSILTLLPHKKVATVLGLDQASLAIAQCRHVPHHQTEVRRTMCEG